MKSSSFRYSTLLSIAAVAAQCASSVAAAPPASDPMNSWPAPRYQVVIENSVMVPMRDGTKLSTDIYKPVGAQEKLPVIVIRTPYNKRTWRAAETKAGSGSEAFRFAEQGYVVVVQDTRGKFESEGEFTISTPDDIDGYDTVTWAATQPWSTGKVGTYGCSYLGENQIESAKLRNPHLAAMIPQAASGGTRYFGQIVGGAVELATAVGWYWGAGSKDRLRPPAGAGDDFWATQGVNFFPGYIPPAGRFEQISDEMLNHLPTVDTFKKFGGPRSDYEAVLSNPPNSPWWKARPYANSSDKFDVPALHVNSWYDYGVEDVFNQFNLLSKNALSEAAKNNQFIIISPTTHCLSEGATEQTLVGARDVGDARLGYWRIYLNWFDHWLKGADNGVTKMPKVQIYVMGKNQWRSENEWPLARARPTKYFLASRSSANSRNGDGVLTTVAPSRPGRDTFDYDPANPVPSIGGPLCCTRIPNTEGSFDQARAEERRDVLVYTTPPLAQGVEVTGPLKAVLFVSSSAKDTDFTAKLVDVYPDGTAYNIQEGILRARYRKGYESPVWMQSGKVYQLEVDIQATSNYFPAGHRIRLEISSSNFPRFDRNMNTGGNNYDETKGVVAHNTIWHEPGRQSYVLLPIVPPDR